MSTRLRWPKKPQVVKVESYFTGDYSITRYRMNNSVGNWHAEYGAGSGQTYPLGEFATLDDAKRACREHFKNLKKQVTSQALQISKKR